MLQVVHHCTLHVLHVIKGKKQILVVVVILSHDIVIDPDKDNLFA